MKQLSPELLIDLDLIRENTLKLKNLTNNKSKFMAILKSDAYGHNIKKVSKAIDNIVDGYGVVKLEEAKKLREERLFRAARFELPDETHEIQSYITSVFLAQHLNYMR